MKRILLFTEITVIMAICFSCKKDNSTNPASTSDDSDYYVQYTDNGAVNNFNVRPVSNPYFETQINAIWEYRLTNTSNDNDNDNNFFIILPADSSSIKKIIINKKYCISGYDSYFDVTVKQDSAIGFLYYYSHRLNETGTDWWVNTYTTEKYYNKITSLKYLRTEYSSIYESNISYYEITGEFFMQIKNKQTFLTRDLTNGSYKLVALFRSK
jgi:hypothetical protein